MALVYDRRQVELSYAIPKWFREMTEDAQKQYLKDHPNSRISRIVKHTGDKLLKKKEAPSMKEVDGTPAQEILEKKGSPTDFQGPRSAGNSLTGEPRKERRIVVMMDKLAKLAQLAKEKGKEMPDFDLCEITIPGTNLFCSSNKGIPRKEMPQLKGKPKPGSWADKNLDKDKNGEVNAEPFFKKMLQDEGIKIEKKVVDVATLKATQSQLVGPKIAGMLQALKKDPNHKGINAPIYVSRDGYILDGHHRWAALVMLAMADGLPDPVQMEVIEVDMDIEDLVDKTNEYCEKIGIATKAGKQKEDASVKGCGCGCGNCGKQETAINSDAYVSEDDGETEGVNRLPRTPMDAPLVMSSIGEPNSKRVVNQDAYNMKEYEVQFFIQGTRMMWMDTGLRLSIQDMAKNNDTIQAQIAEREGVSIDRVRLQLVDDKGNTIWAIDAPEHAHFKNPELRKRAEMFLNDTNPYTGVYDTEDAPAEDAPTETSKLKIRKRTKSVK